MADKVQLFKAVLQHSGIDATVFVGPEGPFAVWEYNGGVFDLSIPFGGGPVEDEGRTSFNIAVTLTGGVPLTDAQPVSWFSIAWDNGASWCNVHREFVELADHLLAKKRIMLRRVAAIRRTVRTAWDFLHHDFPPVWDEMHDLVLTAINAATVFIDEDDTDATFLSQLTATVYTSVTLPGGIGVNTVLADRMAQITFYADDAMALEFAINLHEVHVVYRVGEKYVKHLRSFDEILDL